MKRIFLLITIACLIFTSAVYASKQTFYYQSKTGGKVTTHNWTMEPGKDGYIIRHSTDHGHCSVKLCNPDYTTKSWEYCNKETDTLFTAVRIGNTIKISGKNEGEEIQKELTINNKPWIQETDLGFVNFILSDKTKIEFWTLRPKDLKPYLMTARKDKVEQISLNSQTFEAYRIKSSFSGWMAQFWKADYWFRKSDGIFLKYEGVNGRPDTTPKTVTELIKEE